MQSGWFMVSVLLVVHWQLPERIDATDYTSDYRLNIYNLTKKYGYPLETHTVTTKDGYILTMHRIRAKQSDPRKNPILIQHGLLSSSVDWVNSGPKKALALLLSDLGYDVWLGNSRGNTWSRKHITIDPDKDPKKFFDFSFHEVGIYDLPAMIDNVLKSTKRNSLYYIGHSQGTTAFFVMASEKPDYNDKIKLMLALAPVAYMENIQGTMSKALAENDKLAKIIVDIFEINEVSPHTKQITELGCKICSPGSGFQHLCTMATGMIMGYSDLADPDMLPVILSNLPAGGSIKQFFHYNQGLLSGEFAKYDYGQVKNRKMYGSEKPPSYNLSNIRSPVILHYGENDLLAAVEDVQRLAKNLPSLVKNKAVPNENFNHGDFLFARDVVTLLYNDIIAEIKEYP